jgi:hypothetical protein
LVLLSELSHGLIYQKATLKTEYQVMGSNLMVGSGRRSEDQKRGPILTECRGSFTLHNRSVYYGWCQTSRCDYVGKIESYLSEISQKQAEIIEGGWRLINWQGSGTKIY